MKNRFLGEADAYVFLLVAIIVHCGIVIGAHYGGPLLAFGAIVLLAPVALGLILRKPALEPEPLRELAPSTDPKRILVVANETVAEETLAEELRARAHSGTEVLVVCPALNSRLRHWTSDEDAARTAAESRLDASLERLAVAGVQARGHVGDADPVQAIDDALRTFDADEIVLSTHPPERSHWLARNITERAQRLFGLPVTHIVVDRAREPDVGTTQAAVEGSVA
jgi:GABA permease